MSDRGEGKGRKGKSGKLKAKAKVGKVESLERERVEG
jgi:hypothetical protein